MDAFYASIEQRDRPALAGRPVIVGAAPRGRGVVSAASYEARAYGVRSAMPIGRAARLCPQAAFLPVDMAKYRAVSLEIMAILADFSPLVEPVSVDEAFIDLTGTEPLFGSPLDAVRLSKQRIRRDTELTASAGLAPNKFLAKVASDLEKPDGLVVVPPGGEAAFLAPLRGQAERVAAELRDGGFAAARVTLKLRYGDFETLTRSVTGEPTQDGLEFYRRRLAVSLRPGVGRARPAGRALRRRNRRAGGAVIPASPARLGGRRSDRRARRVPESFTPSEPARAGRGRGRGRSRIIRRAGARCWC